MLSVLRSVERIGSILGLLAAALMVTRYGYQTSIGVIGYLVIISAIVFIVYFAMTKEKAMAPA